MRAGVTILVLLLALFYAFWWAYSYYRDTDPATIAAAAPTCVPPNPAVAVPEATTVNVYNSTTRNGLAASTAKGLTKEGFLIGKIANDPLGKKLPGVAQIRHGAAGTAQAELVLETVGKGGQVVKDKRKGASVDLVLGKKFTALIPLPTPALPACPPPSTPAEATASPTASTQP